MEKLEKNESELHDIHKYSDPKNPNGIAVVDASIKHIKRDLAAEVGKEKGANWSDKVQKVVKDINAKPNQAVHGPPDTVVDNDVQDFLVLKKNAENLQHNTKIENRQKARIESAGAFRSPIDNGGRSFKPAYGKLKQLERVDNEYVYERGATAALLRGESDEAYKTLKHHAIPATPGKFLTDLVPSQRKLLGLSALIKKKTQNQALELENILL